MVRECGFGQALSLTVALSLAAAANQPGQLSVPNDPLLVEQWYLFPPGDRRGSPGSINAIEAWRHIKPAKPIIVALIDGGVNYKHPDLAPNIWTNEREIRNGKDDDGNGYIDDLHGWDFAYANNNPISRPSRRFPEQYDHGTALATLMAAVPDNRIGTAGVGRNIKIMSLRFGGDPEFEGQKVVNMETTISESIRYAAHNGARVIACSVWPVGIKGLEAALKEAERASVLVVWSAGNHGQSIDKDKDYDLLAQHSNILIVGGTIRDGTLSPQMNFGKRVGIAAPCVDMVFPSFKDYERAEGPGTSLSTAIVAGVAGTLLSQEPDLTPAQVIVRLKKASVRASGMEGKISGGRLDMAKLFPR
jgi:subtilisin family serine protease